MQLFAMFTPGESVFVSESQGRIIPTATLTLSYVSFCLELLAISSSTNPTSDRTNIYGTGAAPFFVITWFECQSDSSSIGSVYRISHLVHK